MLAGANEDQPETQADRHAELNVTPALAATFDLGERDHDLGVGHVLDIAAGDISASTPGRC